MGPGFRHALLGLLILPLAACVRAPQERVADEKRQLLFALNDVCLTQAFEKLPVAEIVRRTGLKAEKHLGYVGSFTVYRSPKMGLGPINFLAPNHCIFAVGERGARPDDLAALDLAVANDLANDPRGWRPVNPNDLGHGWCDASNKVFVRTFDSNPENPPPGIKAYIRKMQLQVTVTTDDNGWFCHYLSGLPPVPQPQRP